LELRHRYESIIGIYGNHLTRFVEARTLPDESPGVRLHTLEPSNEVMCQVDDVTPQVAECTATDVKTGWTECVAVRNKAQVHVFAAIRRSRERLSFPLLGTDSDTGSEIINNQLYRYCLREKIAFTRGTGCLMISRIAVVPFLLPGMFPPLLVRCREGSMPMFEEFP